MICKKEILECNDFYMLVFKIHVRDFSGEHIHIKNNTIMIQFLLSFSIE